MGFIGAICIGVILFAPIYFIGHFLASIFSGDYRYALMRVERKRNAGDMSIWDMYGWQIGIMVGSIVVALLGWLVSNVSVAMLGIVFAFFSSWICSVGLTYRKQHP